MKKVPTIIVTVSLITLSVIMFFAGKLYESVTRGEAKVQARDYQIDVYQDSTVIFDGDRYVGTMRYDSISAFDKVINFDNQ